MSQLVTVIQQRQGWQVSLGRVPWPDGAMLPRVGEILSWRANTSGLQGAGEGRVVAIRHEVGPGVVNLVESLVVIVIEDLT